MAFGLVSDLGKGTNDVYFVHHIRMSCASFPVGWVACSSEWAAFSRGGHERRGDIYHFPNM